MLLCTLTLRCGKDVKYDKFSLCSLSRVQDACTYYYVICLHIFVPPETSFQWSSAPAVKSVQYHFHKIHTLCLFAAPVVFDRILSIQHLVLVTNNNRAKRSQDKKLKFLTRSWSRRSWCQEKCVIFAKSCNKHWQANVLSVSSDSMTAKHWKCKKKKKKAEFSRDGNLLTSHNRRNLAWASSRVYYCTSPG